VSHEDSNTQNPKDTELTRSPETSHAVTDKEGKQSTSNRSKLDHSRDIASDVGLLDRIVRVKVDSALEIHRVKGSRDEALVDTTGSAHEAKGEHGEP
jgi:hypothetical protein